MSQGFSFETFGAVVNASKVTLYKWTKDFPDFMNAKKEAFLKNQYFWEKIGIDNLHNRDFNNVMWIFNMKNRHRWSDRVEQQISFEDEQEYEQP